jgi:hypothetical protein
MTRLKLGFVKDTYFDHRGLLQWIVDDLNYANCHQPKAHDFITRAFEEHAGLLGLYDVDVYLKNLNELKGRR